MSLTIDPIDETRFSVLLLLEDRSFGNEGGEQIHELEIKGELSIPSLQIIAIEPRAIRQPFGLEIEPRLENACIALRSDSPAIRDARRKHGAPVAKKTTPQ